MSRRDALKVIALSGARTSFAVRTLGAATSFSFLNNARAESIAPYSMLGDLSVFWGKPGPENAPIKLPSDARIVLQNAKAAIGRTPVLACCDIVFIPCRTVSPAGVVRLNQPLRLIGVNGGGRVVCDKQVNFADPVTTISVDASRGVFLLGNSRTNNSTAVFFSYLEMPSYRITVEDVLVMAEHMGIKIGRSDAAQIAAAFPTISCEFLMSSVGVRHTRSASWTVAASIAAGLGAVVGGLIGGPAGAAVGIAVGINVGLGIGLTISRPDAIPTRLQTPLESRETNFALSNPKGPYSKSSLYEDLFDTNFPRYGDLRYAGSLAFASPSDRKKLRVYYPKDDAVRGIQNDPNVRNSYQTASGRLYKYIFVIAQAPNGMYQVRIHPDDFYPDAVSANERVNHSQLSEGSRLYALLGYRDMVVYGAGTLYVMDNVVVGIDTRSGHYFRSFVGRDLDVAQNSVASLQALGYDTKALECTTEEACQSLLARMQLY